MLDALVFLFCVFVVVGIRIYAPYLRPPGLGRIFFVLLGAPFVVGATSAAARQFGVVAEWWIVPLLTLLILPFYYGWLDTAYSYMRSSRSTSRAQLNSSIAVEIDKLFAEGFSQ